MTLIKILLSLFIAHSLGRIVVRLKLPAILGWLIAGMAIGPYLFNIMSQDILDNPRVNLLFNIMETFGGIMLGVELIYKDLKKLGRNIVTMTVFQSFLTFSFVFLVFSIVFHMANLPIYLAFVFGSIALATAPAPSIAIVRQYNTKGPVTNTLVPMAVLDDLVAIIVFFTTIAIVRSNFSGQGVQVLPILAMILGPISIGGIVGAIGALIARNKSDKASLVLFIGSMFLSALVGIYINTYIATEPFINFFMVGIAGSCVFINMIKFKTSVYIVDKSGKLISLGLMFVILMMGTSLDWRGLLSAGIFTAIYILSRGIGKYFGCFFGGKITGSHRNIQKFLGLTMLPHSGVSIFFTGISSTTIAPFDPKAAAVIQGTIAVAAIINEIIAILLAKKAFQMAGEMPENT